ncbi:MAG: CHASE2 domain-containing protein [Bacteroidetes bacterium]|nr:CHASE2 domain-containing protein [Bacteroidota bacterium]
MPLYSDDIILVNVAHRSRYEIAQMTERIEACRPRVAGFDILFSSRADSGNHYLKAVFARYSNCVVSSRGRFESSEKGVHAEPGLLQEDSGYANLAGIDKEHQTVRYFYPYYNGRAAFSTAILRKYDAGLAAKLDSTRNVPWEIHYSGGDNAFRRLDYSSISKGLDSSVIRDRIVLFGYLGAEHGVADSNARPYTIDEDRLFTPLNDRLSGRSYPDMYGVAVHANILRMMLNGDYIRVVPGWGIWLTAFVISLLLVPVICRWFYTKGVWFHLMSRLLQFMVAAAIIAGSLLLYNFAHIRLEPLLPAAIVLLLVDFVLFYHLLLPLPKEE